MRYRALLVGALLWLSTPALAHEEVVSKLLDSKSTPALSGYTPKDRRDITCTALAVYHEAGNQSERGQRAVANVIMNRTKHPNDFAGTPCGVVFQVWHGRHQFSFVNKGRGIFPTNAERWEAAVAAAIDVIKGGMEPVRNALYFYNPKAGRPGWSRKGLSTIIGAHVFVSR